MGLNILDRIQAKIELFRLEQRYTRRRNRRSTFVSNAIYVDGEYIYNTPNTTGSSTTSNNSSSSKNSSPSRAAAEAPELGVPERSQADIQAQKRLNRWSSMPGFGSVSMSGAGNKRQSTMPQVQDGDWRVTPEVR